MQTNILVSCAILVSPTVCFALVLKKNNMKLFNIFLYLWRNIVVPSARVLRAARGVARIPSRMDSPFHLKT